MLRRSVKVQLIIFVIITLAGVAYVGAKYVGLANGLLASGQCTVHADFTDSGGIFTNAEVTYRGVTIGKVGTLRLIRNGVQADLDIDNCSDPKVPADSRAAVSDRSVIGEQYINLLPPDDKGPYLNGGEVIPMSRTTIPVSAQALLTNLDTLVTSVNTNKLRTVIGQLGKAFNQRGPALGSLLDSTNDLLNTAQANLPETLSLIDNASTVLDRQIAEQGPLQSFSHSLNLLSAQLKQSDPDIRRLLNQAPGDLGVVRKFVQDNRTDLGVTLANLAEFGTLLVRHLDGIEQIFELYPALAAGGQTIVHTNGDFAALGLIVNSNDPPDCGDPRKGSEGYENTSIRSPGDLSPEAPNVAAHCTAPVSSGTNIRGSAHVPGGDPISATGGNVAYPRGTTANTIRVGTALNGSGILGDKAWVAMLDSALH